MRNRIALVVQLFKESGKAIQSMPLLLIQPMVVSLFFKIIDLPLMYILSCIKKNNNNFILCAL